MTRLVFQLADSVGPDNTQYVTISLEEPSVFDSSARPFACDGSDPAFSGLVEAQLAPDAIRAAGQRLFDAVASHPELAQYLGTALQTQNPQRYPVFVEIRTGAGIESLPWEALCSPQGDFLGLDERWALGRIIEGPTAAAPYWHLSPPLRLTAVLSCLGVPAADEWQALQATIAAAKDLKVEVQVFVSESSLYDQIDTAIKAGEAPGVTLELVPSDLETLQKKVGEFRPQVLHFFCHGSAEGSPHLQLAVKSDWVTNTPDNSLLVEAREIRDFTARTDDPPWLVVLNCCEGAAPGDRRDLQSLALRLVYDGGVPAVVGMREPVLSDDASTFTTAFYTRLCQDLADQVTGKAAEKSIDWSRMVVDARTRLAKKRQGLTLSQAAASTKEWTLPVVYVRSADFTVQLVSGAPPAEEEDPVRGGIGGQILSPRAVRLQIEALRGLMSQLPPGTPPELSADIDAQLKKLTSQLETA